MSTPVCKVHNVPMRASDKSPGAYYCPKKDGDVWCKERAKSSEGAAPPAPALAPPQRREDSEVLSAASLVFAALLFKGAGPEMADEAIALAIKACSAMKATR
jgi:hypothetical protein